MLPESLAPAPPLAILTVVHGARDGDVLLLDQKAFEGLTYQAAHWDGPVIWMLSFRDEPPSYFGRYDPGQLSFTVTEVRDDRTDVLEKLPEGALLVANADDFNDFKLAEQLPERLIYTIEYTLSTRYDILRTAKAPLHRKLRSALWQWSTERRRRRALSAAWGVQSNGLPTYNAYRAIARHPMTYFDTRLSDAWQIGSETLHKKQQEILSGQPLRLAFSGRIIRMKGAHYLLPLMAWLDRAGMDYVFEIFGDGEIVADLRAAASDRLIVHGPLAFPDDWASAMQERIHLFVCPHLQGDPSCTYLETLGCGIPIVGFANEAWAPLADLHPVGRKARIGDVAALAAQILELDRNRTELANLCGQAAQFAAQHSMEKAFDQRIAHQHLLAEHQRDRSLLSAKGSLRPFS